MEQPTSDTRTKLSFDDNVIKKIAGIASRNVDGVLSLDGGMLSNLTNRFREDADPTQGVAAEVGEKQVALEMKITVEYGKDIQQIFRQLCQQVKHDIEKLTGLEVVSIDVTVNDVMSKKEWQTRATGKPNSNVSKDNVQ